MNRSLLQAVLRRVEVAAANGSRGLGDAELLRRFVQQRDEAAFDVLVGRHGPLVWAVCRNLLPNETDAEDAFQATFLALVQSAGRIRTAAVGAWLHGVALRVAQMTKRSAGRRRQRERKAATTEATSPVADSVWTHLQAAVHEEVGQLPEPLRVAFVLCNLQGKSQREVAAELGWKLGTLSGRLSKARQRLLERLSKRGIAAGSAVGAIVTGGAEGIACAPPALVAKVAAMARGGLDLGRVASPSLLELARAATEVTMTRTKLLTMTAAATGLLVVGLTMLPPGSAQDKAPNTPAVGTPGAGADPSTSPGTRGAAPRSATSAWEYKYVVRESNILKDFQSTLTTHVASGWEYIGTETLNVPDYKGAMPVMVFKRPASGGRAQFPPVATSGSSSGGFGGGSTGSGFGGFGSGSGFGGAPKTPPPISPMSGAAPPAPRREVQIVALKHIMATTLAKSLQDLFVDANVRIVAEQQTNSLLIQADRPTFDALVKLLDKLDVPTKKVDR